MVAPELTTADGARTTGTYWHTPTPLSMERETDRLIRSKKAAAQRRRAWKQLPFWKRKVPLMVTGVVGLALLVSGLSASYRHVKLRLSRPPPPMPPPWLPPLPPMPPPLPDTPAHSPPPPVTPPSPPQPTSPSLTPSVPPDEEVTEEPLYKIILTWIGVAILAPFAVCFSLISGLILEPEDVSKVGDCCKLCGECDTCDMESGCRVMECCDCARCCEIVRDVCCCCVNFARYECLGCVADSFLECAHNCQPCIQSLELYSMSTRSSSAPREAKQGGQVRTGDEEGDHAAPPSTLHPVMHPVIVEGIALGPPTGLAEKGRA